jgi:Reverse transcriptase (RNA-dependent DNA polymerase)
VETYQSLVEKHPPHPEPSNYPHQETLTEISPITCDEVRKGILHFPPGSAGGLDSLRPQILKDLISASNGEAGDKLVEAITAFMQKTISGKTPFYFAKIFFGASLTALMKKCGGIRPVAVGNIWRRLAAKIICQRLKPISTMFAPHQLGVNVKGGSEAGSHAARIFYNSEKSQPTAFIKIDFRNAFNEVRRDKMLQQVLAFCPEFFPFINQAYGTASDLFYGTKLISSERGCQQGDPLGSFLFSLTIQSIHHSSTEHLVS